jgi:hypothetical protein
MEHFEIPPERVVHARWYSTARWPWKQTSDAHDDTRMWAPRGSCYARVSASSLVTTISRSQPDLVGALFPRGNLVKLVGS